MDWNKKFNAINESGRIIISGVLTLLHGTTTVVDPARHPEKTVEDLKIFHRRGMIQVNNNVVEAKPLKMNDIAVKKLETTKANGKKNEHVVLDAPKPIEVAPIDLGGKPVSVTEPIAETPKVVADEKMTKEEATELLGLHWKRFESEVGKMTDKRKLNFLLIVADESGAADKKKQIIEARLEQI
ncbi:hypothetical protein [Paenibacillus illinoisensis]|uniref:hypothetical protein n=1 Tax=Paenibacillus illinoisensis TaxID=59845 RepID=UPI00301A20CB